MLRRILSMLLLISLGIAATGCGMEQNRGVNKDRDRPREGPPLTTR